MLPLTQTLHIRTKPREWPSKHFSSCNDLQVSLRSLYCGHTQAYACNKLA